MARQVVADVLLGLAVVTTLGASVGVLVMRDAYQKLHFVTPAALVAPFLVALAIFVQMDSPPSASARWRWACRTCTTSCRSGPRPGR